MSNDLMVAPSSSLSSLIKTSASAADVDRRLLQRAMALTGARTEREVLEIGLRTLIRMHQQDLDRLDADEYAAQTPFGGYLG